MKTGEESQEKPVKRLTPGETIRAYCLHCVGGSAQDVKVCDATDPKYHVCPFHPFRLGKGRPSVKIIRKFCLQCMGDYADFVRDCETKDCFCYPYRMGRNPYLTGRRGRSGEWMRSINPKKRQFMRKSDENFQRSPLAPTPTPPGDERNDLNFENGFSRNGKETSEGRGPSLQRNTPSFALGKHPHAAGEKENPGGIPDPTPGQERNVSLHGEHSGGITPEGQAPDPSYVEKSGKRGRVQEKWEQIPLFPLKGIHNPYPGGKRKISGRKQASSIQK